MDVWSPIDCPCKETWVANGEPVWDISVMYWLDEVVEWPAGSDTLWIAIDSAQWRRTITYFRFLETLPR